jgi:hypothetical protein
MKTAGLFLALVLAAGNAGAASQVVPSAPLPFETVNLRTVVDSCEFSPFDVRVDMAGDTLRVTQRSAACSPPGHPMTVDIRLGSFPAGSYRVELYSGSLTTSGPPERLSFEVRGLVEPAVFPPPTRPLTTYTGVWYTPSESGWGISLTQSPTGGLFGTWYVYDSANRPEWYTFQNGQWTSFTTWTATVYRSAGPFLAAPTFDPRFVTMAAVGTVTFDFAIRPGLENRAQFTYTMNGLPRTKSIERLFGI